MRDGGRSLDSLVSVHGNYQRKIPKKFLIQAGSLTRVLTTSMESGTLLCFPWVIMSNFSPARPSHVFNCTGIRFCRKSPAVGSMERQCPFAAFRLAEENARVAVSSRTLASAAASVFRTRPARDTGTADSGLLIVAVADTSGADDGTGAFWTGA